ncbi:MAG TPA: carbohydrate ABC transporter permease [Ktedonobacteraceae bacterium]|jgi:raffinose/stachyose/melibiose transport system permease protein|nr:carbohydrate ABC transporter permease [Ktedonobacteraceae bacterium]
MAIIASSSPGTSSRRVKPGLKLRRLPVHIVLLAGGLIWVFPFLWMLGSSLKSPAGFFNEGLNIIPKEFVWSNYINAWNVGSFGQYFFNTVFVTVSTVILTLVFSAMAGYTLARGKFPGKAAILGAIAITLFLPHGYTIIPVYDLIQRLGLIDSPLIAIILVQTGGSLVFSTFLLMGYFNTIDRELEEAAVIDGAGFNQLFWRVMFPLATPMLATVGLFSFIGAWNDFFVPLVFTFAQPAMRTLSVGMYAFVGENSTNWTYLCAGAVITLAPIMLVFVFLQRYFISAIAGAIKG